MANLYGPRIVTDGLVLCLDAGNSKSYSGSGTVWSDLSGNGKNGTLTNGPTYSSINKGSIIFDGTNDRIDLPTNFFSYPSLTTFSISLWFKSSQTSGGTLFGQQNTNDPNSTTGWIPVIYLTSSGYVRVEPFWTGNIANNILGSQILNNNIWHNVTLLYNTGTLQLYTDGKYDNQKTGISLVSYTTTYYYFIGAGNCAQRSLGTNFFNGNISNFYFYSRALSANEVSQNYNATKGRFGL